MLQVLSGMDPQRVVFAYDPTTFAARVAVLSGAPSQLCTLIRDCLHPNAQQRPTQEAVIDCLRRVTEVYASPAGKPAQKLLSPLIPPGSPQLTSLLTGSLRWLTSPAALSVARSGLWCSPDLDADEGQQSGKMSPKFSTFRSASRGVAGVIYGVSTLKQGGYSCAAVQPLVEAAVDWLLRHEPSPDDQMPGLHFGEAGVAVALCSAISSGPHRGRRLGRALPE